MVCMLKLYGRIIMRLLAVSPLSIHFKAARTFLYFYMFRNVRKRSSLWDLEKNKQLLFPTLHLFHPEMLECVSIHGTPAFMKYVRHYKTKTKEKWKRNYSTCSIGFCNIHASEHHIKPSKFISVQNFLSMTMTTSLLTDGLLSFSIFFFAIFLSQFLVFPVMYEM